MLTKADYIKLISIFEEAIKVNYPNFTFDFNCFSIVKDYLQERDEWEMVECLNILEEKKLLPKLYLSKKKNFMFSFLPVPTIEGIGKIHNHCVSGVYINFLITYKTKRARRLLDIVIREMNISPKS